MNKQTRLFLTLAGIISMFILGGCQATHTSSSVDQYESDNIVYDVENLNSRLNSGLLTQKVDNLLVIVDDTSSMGQSASGSEKRDAANLLVNRIARTIPDINLVRAIRIYGPYVDEKDYHVSLSHGMARSPSDQLAKKVFTETVADTQFNPLAMALEGAYHELKLVPGNSAIIVISDFKDPVEEMLTSGSLISQYYDERVCVYPIVIGADGPGRNSAENLIATVGCGITAMSGVLQSGTQLADYMEKVLFNRHDPISPPAPFVPKVEEKKVEKTISYPRVLREREVSIELKTQFDFDKSDIKGEYLDNLNEIVEFMNSYSDTVLTVEGHTCSIGTEAYNTRLSIRRAEGVKKHLVDLGIDPTRINTIAFGEVSPIADNQTQEGRMKNRRAVAVITTVVKEYVEPNK